MPIYAYECQQCGHRFDLLQRLSDPDPETCPACEAAAVKRALTAAAFRLKGSGWYETDFKKDKETRRNLVDSGEPAKAGEAATSAEGKGGSAPAKAEATPAKTDSTPVASPAASTPPAG